MIRIMHVIPSLGFTGAARQLAQVAIRLPNADFEVSVAALENGGPFEQGLRDARLPVDVLGKHLTFDPATVLRLRKLIDERDPHVVHAWEATAHNYVRLALGRRSDRRLVATESHCRSKSGFERWVENRLVERTSWLIVDSPHLADECAEAGFPSARIAHIPRGTEIPPEEPIDRDRGRELQAHGLPNGARVAGYVGELTRERRVRDMLWGINLLTQLTTRAYFLAVGDGPERARLEEYADRIGRAEFIRFTGEGDAANARRIMDLYWSVGNEESVSCGLLEAMAAGIPPIVSDTPAHRELVLDGETGIVIDGGDSVGLAQFSDRLLADPARREDLGAAARERIRTEFPLEKTVSTHAELYRSLHAEST